MITINTPLTKSKKIIDSTIYWEVQLCQLQMQLAESSDLEKPLLRRRKRKNDKRTIPQLQSFSVHDSYIKPDSEKERAKFDDFVQQQYQEKSSKNKQRRVFSSTLIPDDTLMMFWQLIVLICILIYFVELPIAITFSNEYREQTRTEFLFEIINIPALLIFGLNIIVKTRTAYYEQGLLINDPKKIRKHYLKFLILDVLSLAAVSVTEGQQVNGNDSTQVDKFVPTYSLIFYIKIIELYQIDKSINRSLQLHRRLKAVFNMSMLIFYILFLSSAYACIFFSISKNYCDTHKNETDDLSSMCWIEFVVAEGKTISKQTWEVQYAYSLYWASTTMLTVGYGDITPKNRYEVIFDIVAEFTSCLVFAYSVNKIWEIKQELNEKKEKYQKNWNVINRYMRDKSVKSSVKSKVNAYLAHFYRHQKLRQTETENQIISQLAPGLKEQLFMESYGFIFRDFNVFKAFSEDLFIELVYKIKQIRYSQNEIIYHPSQQQHDFKLSYLFKGEVQVYLPLQNRKYTICRLPTGEMYGDYQFFSNLSGKSVVEAECYCLVYCIKLSDWKQVIYELYDDFERFCEIRDCAQFLNNLKPLRMNCWICESDTHLQQDCANYKMYTERINHVKRYKDSQNQRDKTTQRRRFKQLDVMCKSYLKDLKAIQELVINFGSGNESMLSKVSSEIDMEPRMESSAGEVAIEIIQQRQPRYFQENQERPRRRQKTSRVQRAMSSNYEHLRGKLSVDMSITHKDILSVAEPRVPIAPAPVVPITLLNITELDIDQKESYQFYFKKHNIEQIINHHRMPVRNSMGRRTFIPVDKSAPW